MLIVSFELYSRLMDLKSLKFTYSPILLITRLGEMICWLIWVRKQVCIHSFTFITFCQFIYCLRVDNLNLTFISCLWCIKRIDIFHLAYSAGGMALSTLVPATVSSISLLAKSSNPGLQLWALHALLLTIEAAGLSYVSQVQVNNCSLGNCLYYFLS